jgi:ATP synthase protein I
MSDDRESFEQRDEDARLGRLDERLARAEATEATRTGADRPMADPNARLGNRVLAELIGGMAGGALVGWLLDRLLGSWPWGFLIVLTLGIIVAFRNIIRLSNAISRQGSSAPDRD